MRPRLVELRIADPPERWQALGFTVDHMAAVDLGGVRLRLGARGRGIVGWTLSGIGRRSEIDGLQTEVAAEPDELWLETHPNGAIAVDHVVVIAPDFDRTAAALEHAGMPLRRVRQVGEIRQGFRRLGPAILELVESPTAGEPARFWGLVVTVDDLDALAARLGEHLGQIKPAVQPGRKIATLRASAGLGEAVAFMDP